ncbi:hypothetical protein BJ684DRAFT_16428 [Piptocephalis cylindrospora]|uniref:Uncharacterized protein n=1 Tax=Piptocephalis cylindrospora TaxID=1907219 RepID=A0A4P9Y2L5_9FUNG|nr:hypothetical protein BJ684DRAFT_16428 [Piptocephalis cylindrospora]|eukprot:RKP13146.1 hypothetical protein BJ684DRAFT_16428 [Piptocephalis cylindrospora]
MLAASSRVDPHQASSRPLSLAINSSYFPIGEIHHPTSSPGSPMMRATGSSYYGRNSVDGTMMMANAYRSNPATPLASGHPFIPPPPPGTSSLYGRASANPPPPPPPASGYEAFNHPSSTHDPSFSSLAHPAGLATSQSVSSPTSIALLQGRRTGSSPNIWFAGSTIQGDQAHRMMQEEEEEEEEETIYHAEEYQDSVVGKVQDSDSEEEEEEEESEEEESEEEESEEDEEKDDHRSLMHCLISPGKISPSPRSIPSDIPSSSPPSTRSTSVSSSASSSRTQPMSHPIQVRRPSLQSISSHQRLSLPRTLDVKTPLPSTSPTVSDSEEDSEEDSDASDSSSGAESTASSLYHPPTRTTAMMDRRGTTVINSARRSITRSAPQNQGTLPHSTRAASPAITHESRRSLAMDQSVRPPSRSATVQGTPINRNSSVTSQKHKYVEHRSSPPAKPITTTTATTTTMVRKISQRRRLDRVGIEEEFHALKHDLPEDSGSSDPHSGYSPSHPKKGLVRKLTGWIKRKSSMSTSLRNAPPSFTPA